MPVSDQGVTHDRYMLVPRVAIFLRRGDSYLLIKGAPTKRLWAGKYNCIGGHVERGEDVYSAAQRELLEETGISAELWLCGIVIVDAGEVGICLYVLTGESTISELVSSAEGLVEWVAYERVGQLEVVEDLPILLAKVHQMKREDVPFSARSYYDEKDHLIVSFTEESKRAA